MFRVTVVRGNVSRTADFEAETASFTVRAAVASGLGVTCRPVEDDEEPITGIRVDRSEAMAENLRMAADGGDA